MDLSDWISRRADFTPDKPAILFEGGAISYASLADQIDRFSQVLGAELAIKTGDRVAYLGLNSPELISLIFACACVGAIFLPLNWRLAAPEHAQLLQHARPLALFAEGDFLEHINGVKEQFENVVLVRFNEPGSGQSGVLLISLNVDNTRQAVAEAEEKGYPVIGGIRQFRNCEFAFLHPKKMNGVLLELIVDK